MPETITSQPPTITLKESSWEVIEDGHELGVVSKVGRQFMATSILRRPHLGVFVATKQAAAEAIITFAHTDESDGLVEKAAEAAWNASAVALGHETWWANVLDDPARDGQREYYRITARAALASAGAL